MKNIERENNFHHSHYSPSISSNNLYEKNPEFSKNSAHIYKRISSPFSSNYQNPKINRNSNIPNYTCLNKRKSSQLNVNSNISTKISSGNSSTSNIYPSKININYFSPIPKKNTKAINTLNLNLKTNNKND